MICFCIKFALTDSAESVGNAIAGREGFSPRKRNKIRFNGRADFHLRKISSPTFLLESNNTTALTAVQLITSRVTSRCVARCRQLRSSRLKRICPSVPFVCEVERSGVRAEEKGLYRSFRGIGLLGSNPLVRSRARQAVIV